MNVNEFQKYCTDFVKQIDAKYNIERTPQLSFTQLIEEVWELAKDVNSPKLRNKPIDMNNLKWEFADVILQVYILADIHWVNIEKSVINKIEEIKVRHSL